MAREGKRVAEFCPARHCCGLLLRHGIVIVALLFLANLANGCAGFASKPGVTKPAAASATFGITGTITPATGGAGAAVALSGAKTAQATTDSSGIYSFTGLSAGQYTLTPSHAGFTFSPASQTITLSSSDVTNVNFTAAAAAAAAGHQVTLSWNASVSAVLGYNVYRSTVSGGSYEKMNAAPLTALTFTDATVHAGTTYFYVTTAVDASGNESGFSNEATAKIP